MTDLEYRELLARAQAGDADAQSELGDYFDVEKRDDANARYWYERAARQGDAVACWNLALMYQNGQGVAADAAKALRYYLAAGRNGDPEGFYFAGLRYDYGEPGIRQNHAKANRCYRLAADAGIPQAACNLGSNYHEGVGVRRDWKKSFHYTRFAAENGDELAYHQLGENYALGHGTRRNYRRAFAWFKKSWFATGSAIAARLIGDCYMRGRGVKRHPRKMFLWQKRAAELGDEHSIFELGLRYLLGEGTAKNTTQAQAAFRRFLELQPGDIYAPYWLGKSYESNHAEALPYFEELYRRDRDPWSAYEIVRLKLARRRPAPAEFAELDAMLRHAARRQIAGAKRLLGSRRWRDLREYARRTAAGSSAKAPSAPTG